MSATTTNVASEELASDFQVAFALLQQAAAADTEGATDISLRLYGECCARFEQLLLFCSSGTATSSSSPNHGRAPNDSLGSAPPAIVAIPAAHCAVIHKHLASIRQRMEVLKAEKTLGGAANISANFFPQFQQPFMAQPLPIYDEKVSAPPASSILRPFWLMQLLSNSMQSGAYITKDIYVSKAIWLQDGATTVVAGIGRKVKYLSALCEVLEEVQLLSHHDVNKFQQGLDRFLTEAEKHYEIFLAETGKSKKGGSDAAGSSSAGGVSGEGASGGGAGGGVGGHLDPVVPQRSKFNRGVRELIHRGQNVLKNWKQHQNATYSSYIAWSVNVLEQAQLFHRWILYFSQSAAQATPPKVMDRLYRVANTFFMGPCRFLLFDMFLLLERSTGKTREAFSRLLPVTIQLKEKESAAAPPSSSSSTAAADPLSSPSATPPLMHVH